MTRLTQRQEFTARTKQQAFDRSDSRCEGCGAKLGPWNLPEYDHRKACCDGGDNSLDNCEVLGSKCCSKHREKSADETRRCAKADKLHRKHIGIKPKTRRRLPYRRFDGTPVDPNREARR